MCIYRIKLDTFQIQSILTNLDSINLHTLINLHTWLDIVYVIVTIKCVNIPVKMTGNKRVQVNED